VSPTFDEVPVEKVSADESVRLVHLEAGERKGMEQNC